MCVRGDNLEHFMTPESMQLAYKAYVLHPNFFILYPRTMNSAKV